MKLLIKWQYWAMLLLLTACTASDSHKVPQVPRTGPILAPVQKEMPPLVSSRAPVGKGTQILGGLGTRYRVVAFSDLPHWESQSFLASLQVLRHSCVKLINNADWAGVCRTAMQMPDDESGARLFFESLFTPWQVSQNNKLSGTVTGYYEPELAGSRTPTAQARFPIYGIPDDFISVPYRGQRGTVRVSQTGSNTGMISSNGTHWANLAQFPINSRTRFLKGRFEGNRFVPYYTRSQINAGALNGKAPILGYANDPVELFFLHIQGSGRLKTPTGEVVRLGFADKNEYPFVSIATYMARQGYLPLAQTNMQSIKSWMAQNPHKLAEVLGENPSYIFFQQSADGRGPLGALGVELTGGFSCAVDAHHITLGAPLFVATTDPRNGRALNRLMVAQDTGSAITGAVRVDFFWGFGDEAGQLAGKMKFSGYVWMLLPHGVMPRFRS